jgi:hypothetical protein
MDGEGPLVAFGYPVRQAILWHLVHEDALRPLIVVNFWHWKFSSAFSVPIRVSLTQGSHGKANHGSPKAWPRPSATRFPDQSQGPGAGPPRRHRLPYLACPGTCGAYGRLWPHTGLTSG